MKKEGWGAKLLTCLGLMSIIFFSGCGGEDKERFALSPPESRPAGSVAERAELTTPDRLSSPDLNTNKAEKKWFWESSRQEKNQAAQEEDELNNSSRHLLPGGASEEPQATPRTTPLEFYVDVNGGSDYNDGTSPASPFKTLTKALENSQPGDKIRVAEGTYTQESGENFNFRLQEGIEIIGGYSRDFRRNDPINHRTTIDAGTNIQAFSGNPENLDIKGIIIIKSLP